MFSIARTIEISGGRGITFRNTAPKNLSFTNRLAMFITSALKSIKRGNVTKEQISRISELLHKEDKDSVPTFLGRPETGPATGLRSFS